MNAEVLSYEDKPKGHILAVVKVYPSWWQELWNKIKIQEYELFYDRNRHLWWYTDPIKLVANSDQDIKIRYAIQKHMSGISERQNIERLKKEIEEARNSP